MYVGIIAWLAGPSWAQDDVDGVSLAALMIADGHYDRAELALAEIDTEDRANRKGHRLFFFNNVLIAKEIRIFLLMNINSCILYFCKFTRKCPIVKPNNNSVFSFSSSRQDRKTGGIFFQKRNFITFPACF